MVGMSEIVGAFHLQADASPDVSIVVQHHTVLQQRARHRQHVAFVDGPPRQAFSETIHVHVPAGRDRVVQVPILLHEARGDEHMFSTSCCPRAAFPFVRAGARGLG